MNFAHIHLLLNHLPIIGTMVGAGLFLISFFANTEDLRRSSLIIFAAMALLAIPTFITGFGAQVQILTDPEVSRTLIQKHLGAAELALWFIEITGALAVIELWRSDGPAPSARWNTAAVLVFSLLTVGLMARTGNTGGDIRHSEIRPNQQVTLTDAFMVHFEPSPPKFASLMIANKWWWAFMMALHFVGLVLVIGTIGLMDLRVLGFAKGLPIASLNKLVPWGLAGLGINVVTGLLAFIGMSAFYTYNIAFLLKIVVVLIATVTLGLFYVTGAFRDCEAIGPSGDAPLKAKLIAGGSLVLWFAVIVLGRYIQVFENSIPR
jgi:hypothetical protein